MAQQFYRILVVEPDDMLRNALLDYLETCDDLEAVGSTTQGAEAVRLCPMLKPDVMLIEIQLPDMDGIEMIQQLKKQCPDSAIVVLTASLQSHRMGEAIEAGVLGFLEKGVPIQEVMKALRLAGQQALKRHR